MRVSDVMTRDVACCSPDDPLTAPARIMWEHDCGTVPVIEPESRKALGMITDRDICMAAFLKDRPLREAIVREVMSRELHSCSPEHDLSQAERVLREHQVRRLPVVDKQDRLLGIISLADIARAAKDGGSRREVPPEELADTLGVISQRRSPPAETRESPRAR